jgi:hypothetical protein
MFVSMLIEWQSGYVFLLGAAVDSTLVFTGVEPGFVQGKTWPSSSSSCLLNGAWYSASADQVSGKRLAGRRSIPACDVLTSAGGKPRKAKIVSQVVLGAA